MSASTPNTGVSTIPGSVKMVISMAARPTVISNVEATIGKIGVMLETPIIADRVIQKMMCRFGLRITGGGGVAGRRVSDSGAAGGGGAVVGKIIQDEKKTGGRLRPGEALHKYT